MSNFSLSGANSAPVLFSRPYIAGIGGIGTSGIALLLADLGCHVQGSDLRQSELTDSITARGCTVFFTPQPKCVQAASCLIIPAGLPLSHPECQAACKSHIPILNRTQALACICRTFADKSILCFGTLTRAKAARLLANHIDGCGWCSGAAVRGGSPHAHFSQQIMAIDLDERDFFNNPSLFEDFPHSDILFADFQSHHFGYYPDGFSIDSLFAKCPQTDRRRIIRPISQASVTSPTTLNDIPDLPADPNSIDRHAPCIGPGDNQCFAAVAKYLHCSKLTDSLQIIGWFESIHSNPMHIHDIRMHPVSVHAVIHQLKSCKKHVHAAIKPFISTLHAYTADIWAKAFDGACEIAVIVPPYPGCTEYDCQNFVQSLTDAHLHAHIVSLPILHKSMHPDDAWCLFGAPDIIE